MREDGASLLRGQEVSGRCRINPRLPVAEAPDVPPPEPESVSPFKKQNPVLLLSKPLDSGQATLVPGPPLAPL